MAAENKPKNAPNDPKKRKRCYLPYNRPARKRGPSPIQPGVQGFFITCDGGKEFQASQEAINVIDSFFEELINGKESNTKVAAKPGKPLNKKITFTYSDSDEEYDAEDDGQEESKSIKTPVDGVKNDSNVEEKSDNADKAGQSHDVGLGKTITDDNEADKEKAEGKSEENEEPPEKKQCSDESHDVGSEKAVTDNNEADKEKDEDKSEENEEPPEKKQCSDESHDVGSEKAVTDNNEADKKKDEDKSEENEEPPEKKQCSDVKKPESRSQELTTTELSVDKLIEAELKEVKDKSKRRFSRLDSGCNGVVFIQMRRRDGDPSPGDIVQHLMESAAATKKHMSRFLLRVLPVDLSCYASEEEISRAIKPVVEQHFPSNGEPVKFAVQYDARANSGIERMKIIDAIAKSIPEPHKVDLKNPEKTIIAQIAKTVCMIGVVEKYKELAKYNLRQLTS